jgi:hypothetical protein
MVEYLTIALRNEIRGPARDCTITTYDRRLFGEFPCIVLVIMCFAFLILLEFPIASLNLRELCLVLVIGANTKTVLRTLIP